MKTKGTVVFEAVLSVNMVFLTTSGLKEGKPE